MKMLGQWCELLFYCVNSKSTATAPTVHKETDVPCMEWISHVNYFDIDNQFPCKFFLHYAFIWLEDLPDGAKYGSCNQFARNCPIISQCELLLNIRLVFIHTQRSLEWTCSDNPTTTSTFNTDATLSLWLQIHPLCPRPGADSPLKYRRITDIGRVGIFSLMKSISLHSNKYNHRPLAKS